MPKSYFTPATFRFLRALDRNNSRDWFHAHKDDYERHVREPFLDLITDLQAPLAKISPHYRADPRKNGGSLFRIFRDTRFSNNKLPYKPWQGSRFFHERRHEIPAPSFYMHIQPGDCFAGGGTPNRMRSNAFATSSSTTRLHGKRRRRASRSASTSRSGASR
jgi:uncharacterized protein (TIGR02453 family)